MSSKIFEIVIHGRGGQGAKTAAQLIAESAMEQGKFIQAFPEFGPERRGAPVRAFVRISDEAIKTHEPITEPIVIMVIDPTLLDQTSITESVSNNCSLIVNSNKSLEDIKNKLKKKSVVSKKEDRNYCSIVQRDNIKFSCNVYSVDATKISIDLIGKNIPNMPMLGALVKVTNIVPLNVLTKKIEKTFLEKIGEKATKSNTEMVKRGYEEVK